MFVSLSNIPLNDISVPPPRVENAWMSVIELDTVDLVCVSLRLISIAKLLQWLHCLIIEDLYSREETSTSYLRISIMRIVHTVIVVG